MPIDFRGELYRGPQLLVADVQPPMREAEAMPDRTHSQRSRSTNVTRRSTANGVAGSVAVLSALGMTLFVSAPQAWADETDRITDLFGPPPGVAPGALSDAALFDQYAAERLHDDIAPWVNSPFRPVVDAPSGQYMIGDGVSGAALYPDGGDAGLWFGGGDNGQPGQEGQSSGMSGAGVQNGANNP